MRLGKKLKAQTDIAKKQYQGLNKFFTSDEKKEPTLKKYNKSDLIYNNKYSFYNNYRDSKKFDKLSFKRRRSLLNNFSKELDKSNEFKTQKEKPKRNTRCV